MGPSYWEFLIFCIKWYDSQSLKAADFPSLPILSRIRHKGMLALQWHAHFVFISWSFSGVVGFFSSGKWTFLFPSFFCGLFFARKMIFQFRDFSIGEKLTIVFAIFSVYIDLQCDSIFAESFLQYYHTPLSSYLSLYVYY